MLALILSACQGTPPDPKQQISGTVWQLDNASVDPRGHWDRIGARQLLIQWTAVDGVSFVRGSGLPEAPTLPDWKRIAGEPWAHEVIVGLAGRFDEKAARADVAGLIAQSRQLATLPTPLNVVGWYFPVEIDSSWNDARQLGPLLATLPRPLWISVYDSANNGAETLAQWLAAWLPADVGVLFQDGVGLHIREPSVARHYAQVLANTLGKQRVRVIAEAFRPKPGGGFRAATAAELRPQLAAYRGFSIYLFDGPHYVSDSVVEQLLGK